MSRIPRAPARSSRSRSSCSTTGRAAGGGASCAGLAGGTAFSGMTAGARLHRRPQPPGARGDRAERAAARRRHEVSVGGGRRTGARSVAPPIRASAPLRLPRPRPTAASGRRACSPRPRALFVHRAELHRLRAPASPRRLSRDWAAIGKTSSITVKRRISACASRCRLPHGLSAGGRASATSRTKSGRSQHAYLRFVVRNDCLNALYNDPLPRVLWMLPVRYVLYFRMRRGWRIRDPWGWIWIAREVAVHFAARRLSPPSGLPRHDTSLAQPEKYAGSVSSRRGQVRSGCVSRGGC